MARRGEKETASPSAGGRAARLKFLCSFGGRILPRPSDRQLKYVGGETRVIAVPRSVTFAEMKAKMASVFGADPVIKYRLAAEDLDALVSVTCDEDLQHMIEESDRHDVKCSCDRPRLRVFLFPHDTFDAVAAVAASHLPQLRVAAAAMEQRYIDAINGVSSLPRTPAGGTPRVHAAAAPTPFATSSADASPTSAVEAMAREGAVPRAFAWRQGEGGGAAPFQRVRSSPNLNHLNFQQQALRPPGFHGPATVEHEAGGSGRGGGQRRRPTALHSPGTRYYSPVHTPSPEGRYGGVFFGHADDVGDHRRGDTNVYGVSSPRRLIWE